MKLKQILHKGFFVYVHHSVIAVFVDNFNKTTRYVYLTGKHPAFVLVKNSNDKFFAFK